MRGTRGRRRKWPAKSPKAWTTEEDKYLRENYRALGPTKVALALGRSREAVKNRASKLGVAEKRGALWTPAEDEILRRYYPTFGPSGVRRYIKHRSVIAIKDRARKLGIRYCGPRVKLSGRRDVPPLLRDFLRRLVAYWEWSKSMGETPDVGAFMREYRELRREGRIA